jgi:photosystem II stability/assembly factor-like uncharacterized protein
MFRPPRSSEIQYGAPSSRWAGVRSRYHARGPAGAGPSRIASYLGILLATFGSLTKAAEFSEPAPLAPQSLLIAAAHAGNDLVVVGERGHVLRSSDQGRSWTQVIVPTRALLTGVSFPDAQHGWAVGHDGVILATSDGGKTWTRQDDGKDLETVYLDVLFLDPRCGFAVGAYGKFMVTADGGRTWTAAKPSEQEVHYNRLTVSRAGDLYLAGEAGVLLISRDRGATWLKSDVPYDGSLFGALPVDPARVIIHGLRGHILRSDDRGTTWKEEPNPVAVLVMGSARLSSGMILLAGQGGNFFLSRDDGLTFKHWKPAGFGTSVACVVDAGDGAVLAVGEAGAVRLTLP